jgi:hypothetical protein
MKLGGYYTNDHEDSWQDTWRCTVRHPTPEQKARAAELVEEARHENRARKATEMRALFAAAHQAHPKED